MSYELLERGPAAYIPVILASLIITLLAYGTFPLIFAKSRKKTITKRKYNWLCFGINFVIMMLIATLNGEASSGAPYLLWTGTFTASGIRILKSRGILDGFQKVDCSNISSGQEPSSCQSTSICAEDSLILDKNPPVRFCRKCGFELLVNSDYCSRCGTTITKE